MCSSSINSPSITNVQWICLALAVVFGELKIFKSYIQKVFLFSVSQICYVVATETVAGRKEISLNVSECLAYNHFVRLILILFYKG